VAATGQDSPLPRRGSKLGSRRCADLVARQRVLLHLAAPADLTTIQRVLRVMLTARAFTSFTVPTSPIRVWERSSKKAAYLRATHHHPYYGVGYKASATTAGNAMLLNPTITPNAGIPNTPAQEIRSGKCGSTTASAQGKPLYKPSSRRRHRGTI